MRLAEITPHSFRNLAPEAVAVAAGVTLVAGENAHGKTNLLEAVALLSGQRSFRGAAPAAMAPDGESIAISGTLRRGFESERLSLSWSRGGGRRFVRGEKGVTFREAGRMLPAVFLAPEHRELVLGGPAVRRRFLDRLVLGLFPAAGDELARYEKALASRNALLTRWRDRHAEPAPGELEAWTEELATSGAAVRAHRRRALSAWSGLFRALAREAGAGYAAIEADYRAESESPEELRAACDRLLPAERRRGHSLAGPHRDDLLLTRAGRKLETVASSGEVHRVATIVKLAEWHAVAAAAGEPPFLGVDDFDLGLSSAAADAFWDALPGHATVILTSASDPARWKRRAAAVFEMRQGHALPREGRRAVND